MPVAAGLQPRGKIERFFVCDFRWSKKTRGHRSYLKVRQHALYARVFKHHQKRGNKARGYELHWKLSPFHENW